MVGDNYGQSTSSWYTIRCIPYHKLRIEKVIWKISYSKEGKVYTIIISEYKAYINNNRIEYKQRLHIFIHLLLDAINGWN